MDHSHAWAQRQKGAARGPQLRKSGGPELRKSGGTQLRKLGGSDQRKFCTNDEVRERRRQLRHPAYQKPELLARGPNQVWSWDITKLMGPAKWSYFYLYVIIDIFSRRIVGWHIADAETAALFKPLFDAAIVKHAIVPGQITLHADLGAPMKAKATALMLADLGVTKSHSRPYTSNDNPFSESCSRP